MPVTRPRQCNTCEEKFDVLCFDRRKVYIHMGTDAISSEPTCACGSTDLQELVSNPSFIFGGDVGGAGSIYPYMDSNLVPGGILVQNRQHHKRLMKAAGVVHCTTEDIANDARRRSVESARIDANDKAEREYLEFHPDTREYRRLRDRGALVDHMPKDQQDRAQKGLEELGKTTRESCP